MLYLLKHTDASSMVPADTGAKCGRYGPSNSPGGCLIFPFGTSVCHTHSDDICAKYALVSVTFPHRPDEAM